MTNVVGWFDRRPDMTTPLAPDMRCTSHALQLKYFAAGMLCTLHPLLVPHTLLVLVIVILTWAIHNAFYNPVLDNAPCHDQGASKVSSIVNQ